MTKQKTAYQIALALLIVLALAFGIELLISRGGQPVYMTNDDVVELYPDRVNGVFGYSVQGNLFTPLNDDPQIYLDVADLGELKSLVVAYEAPLNHTPFTQLYYSDENGVLSEENSIILNPGGIWLARFAIPEGAHPVLRLDINSEVRIQSIMCSSSWNGIRMVYPLSRKRIALFLLLFSLVAAALLLLNRGFTWHGRHIAPFEPAKRWHARVRERSAALEGLSESRQRKQAARLAKAFFMIALVCGMLLAFLTPPMSTPDEDVHFVNAYAISRGDIFPEVYEDKLVRWIPNYYKEYLDIYPFSLYGVNTQERYSHNDLYLESYFAHPDLDGAMYPYESSLVSFGYSVSALSMAAGTKLGHLMRMPEIDYPYNQMILGRIGNLLFYVIVGYFAIKRAPHFNKTMALVALLPMSLFQAASLSYDAMAIPLIMYFIATVMRLCKNEDEPLTAGDIIRVLLCVLMLSGMKFGAYMPLFLMLLAIPKKKYGPVGRLVLCILGVGLVVVAGYLPSYIVSAKGAGMIEAKGVVSDGILQTQWLMTNLSKHEIVRLFRQTLKKHLQQYFLSFWGVLGWLDVYLPIPVVLTGYVMLFIVTFFDVCTCSIWRNQRWKNLLPIIGACVSTLGIFLAMYFSYTPVGSSFIDGVQGRYIIPLFPAIAMAFSNQLLLRIPRLNVTKLESWASVLTKGWGICCAAITVFMVLIRYWV